MTATTDALRAEAMERGYAFPAIRYAAYAEPKVTLARITSRSFNIAVADYMEKLPEPLAQAFAVSVLDYITGGSPSIPEAVRVYMRAHSLERYIKRKGFLRPGEVKDIDLDGIAKALKENGQIPGDITVLWTTDPRTSYISPTFRTVAIPTYLLEERDEGEIISEIIANTRILLRRTGGSA